MTENTVQSGLCQECKSALRSLLVYRQIGEDPVIKWFATLVAELDSMYRDIDGPCPAPNVDIGRENTGVEHDAQARCAKVYHRFLTSLLNSEAGLRPSAWVHGSIWQEHLLDLMLFRDNPVVGTLCNPEEGSNALATERLGEILAYDLKQLSTLFWAFAAGLDRILLQAAADMPLPTARILCGLHGGGGKCGVRIVESPARKSREPARPEGAREQQLRAKAAPAEQILADAALDLRWQFYRTRRWSDLAPVLIEYHCHYGTGQFARYGAFTWSAGPERGLSGVEVADPIRLEELEGYEDQVQRIVGNTRRFVQGLPAHNILLYGDRGTGKSSTVKGLLHEFVRSGLRLVEISRENLAGFADLVSYLQRSPLKFIVFIDDLSFEEDETEFKALKSVLEGGVIKRPDNVRIYATSNRRHLIKESFADTDGAHELRWQDTVQEKLSLSDRFGLTVIYPSPDQQTYLDIVQHLADLEGLCIDSKELKEQALQWTLWHNERSGRTARQFIDDLRGRLKMRG